MSIRNPLALVLLLVAALILSGCSFQGAYDLPLPGKQVSKDDGYQVTADFDDVVNVVPRTLVMANDVPVGQVDSVKRVGWHARVTMTVRKDIVLPADAVADVRQTSLLGEKYIALSAPKGSSVAKQGRLEDGAFIPLARTSRNPEVEEVLGALSFLLSGGGVGQLKTISTELNKMMDGRQADIRHLLGQIDTLVGSLDDQKDNIIDAMSSLNRLTATLNRERKSIGAALDSFGPALKVLNDQHRALMTMLHAMDKLGRVGTRVINASKDNLLASLRHLQPVLQKLADAGNSLPRGLMMAASFPFPKQAATLAKGDYSNALFHMDFDLNKLLKGALTGGDTGLPKISQLCAIYGGAKNCAPLMKALCSLVPVDILCAPIGPGTTGNPPDGAKTGKTRAGKKPAGSPDIPGLQKLLGELGKLGRSGGGGAAGGSSGGVLGGLLGGLGLGGSTTSSGPGSGLLGLLGGGRR